MANTAVVEKKKNEVVYEANGEQVTLDIGIVKRFIASGNAESVTDGELYMFMQLCRYNHMNPFLKEAYLVKFGDAAQMITGIETYRKRAEDSGVYDGMESGVIVLGNGVDEPIYRRGEFKLPGDQVVGGWAEVHRKDMSHSFRTEVAFEEYVQLKNGKPNSNWSKRPATMINKVAEAHALRRAFPKHISGMSIDEETDKDTIDIVVEERKAIAEAQSMMGSGGAIDIPAEVIEEPVGENQIDPGF